MGEIFTELEKILDLNESMVGELFMTIKEMIKDFKKRGLQMVAWKDVMDYIKKSSLRIARPDDPEFKTMIKKELLKSKIHLV